jgi:putative ABC transport system permease protein
LELFITKDHGFNMHQNIVINLNNTKSHLLKNELAKHSNIESIAAASHVPAAGISHGAGFKRTIDDPEAVAVGTFTVDEDYLTNMELDLLAGRFFAGGQEVVNKDYIVVNEQAVNKLQFDSPMEAVGKEVMLDYDSSKRTIIGVVSDYNHRDLTHNVSPVALMFDSAQYAVLQVRYSGSYENAAKTIEEAWATVNPGLKVDFKEMESEVRKFYEIIFGDIAKILGFVASLAILISCLGLLGMATYTTQTRMKEVSIRKVLGSSASQIVLLLSKGFMLVLGLAMVIGIPAAFFINNLWLEMIAYHTTISLTVIAEGILILLLFGMLTVGSQTIRAVFVNPVDNLRNE